ncbi:cellulose synthase/poly-beta-1,6-N-acetylglucosamine synthase-like glycosyltransferase [Olsenella profusa DSM 13989]|uniref:glycosyltransferase family 2 protein n=1 Tax=Olsenella profusa TaxID=138595 RepID=UPI00277E0E77|nr:glycosyltransferase family 2 protein [Olsenella profusa]MDP9860107.1 cellulose synthase/poly-beta-1,6-N-acetylglucosamine synthase-like glycosyltransferase [Olsenella profusa DSM 13989]
MDLQRLGITPIVIFNGIVWLFFTLAYFYQLVYIIRVSVRGTVVLPKAKRDHSYAFVIAAHNEEPVIGNLVRSILTQKYDGLADCFVVADACTDATAEEARKAGAITWERNDLARKGKSWVLDYAFDRILNEYGDRYEAFFVMDADNIIAPNYVEIMNRAFDAGYLVCTSYRNSKNFDSSWISSAYATWFLREAKFLNNARMMLGTSCAISGSGWLVSASIIRGMHGWRFHTLTEDIQFSTFCCSHGIQIGYAPAEFFDEQPVTFKASWTQRMRWTKGFYQVFFSYNHNLLHGIRKGSFSSYDMLMTVAPGMILTLLSFFVNAAYLIIGSLSHGFIATNAELAMCIGSLLMTFGSIYVVFLILAVITTVSERKHIHAKRRWRIVTNLFTFPIFMMTYIPITVAALFKKVEWVPTKHDIAVNFDDVMSEDV